MRLTFTDAQRQLRAEAQSFVDTQRDRFEPQCESWMTGFDRDFSRELSQHGWIGITWPLDHGGADGNYVDRLIVTEVLLAAGAPLAAHWFVDRQMAPAILAYGTDEQKARHLPEIRSGDLTYCIGMSEPEAGSDLAAVSTRAIRERNRWRLSSRKDWTSLADKSDYIYLLARTEPGSRRHEGLSEFIVPMDTPGLTVGPIEDMTGASHFHEVEFDDVQVPADALVGVEGRGWHQITAQLAFERAGLERLMSVWPLLNGMRVEAGDDPRRLEDLGELESRALAVRQLIYRSADVADRGKPPQHEAALAKLLGTQVEQDIVATASAWAGPAARLSPAEDSSFGRHLHHAWLAAPSFTIRGGTSEIMRELVSRDLLGAR